MTGFEDIKTEETEEYTELFNRHLADALGRNTGAILSVLSTDSNTLPIQQINGYLTKSSGSKIWIENLETYVTAHILDVDGERAGVVEMSSDKNDPTAITVSPATIDSLKQLSVDEEVAITNVKDSLKEAV